MTPRTVLIADDDLGLLAAMRVRLESEGFTVISTQDAYQAVEQARKSLPDLLILDINMPAGSGFSVQQRLDNIPELADTPVIYITGEDPDQVDSIAERFGAFAVLHKPFETTTLIETSKKAVAASPWVIER